MDFGAGGVVLFKVVSSLLSIVIGFAAGKLHNVSRKSIANLLFYFIAPIVFFAAPMNLEINFTVISVIFTVCALFSILCIVSYYYYRRIFNYDTTKVLTFITSTTNCGFFMIPIVSALCNEAFVSLYIVCIMGVSISESTFGFYFVLRNHAVSFYENIIKIIKIPTLQAFVAGVFCSSMGFKLPRFLHDFMIDIKSTYAILGMALVGLALSTVQRFEIDKHFCITALLINYVFQPLIFILFILLDYIVLHIYDYNYYKCFILISICPIAANTIIIADMINFPIQKIATIIIISIMLELVIAPVIISVLL